MLTCNNGSQFATVTVYFQQICRRGLEFHLTSGSEVIRIQMFGSRRIAKRSIIGTKICAPWKDGRYYPGVIRAQPVDDGFLTEAVYNIHFDDGYECGVLGKDIIGPGFQPITRAVLKNGQKVYVTLNGREVSGLVLSHNAQADEVLINVKLTSGEDLDISQQLEEVRLLESRKSARLVDQDTDYSKLADVQSSEQKKRTVSRVIDVPLKSQRHRHVSDDTDDADLRDDNESNDDVEMMDDNVAAMVLTTLSCSPVSPQFPGSLKETAAANSNISSGHLSSSFASSGFSSNHSERSDTSPPLSSHLSESAPTPNSVYGHYQQTTHDEGIDLEENIKQFYDGHSDPEKPKKEIVQGRTKTVFMCTWKHCGKIQNTCDAIERHVRIAHLGLSESDTDSDHEEEFYYNEMEVDMEMVTQTFSEMCTSSPPSSADYMSEISRPIPVPDHDYQKKEHRFHQSPAHASSVPSTASFIFQGSTQTPIKTASMKRSLSWQNNVSLSPSLTSGMRMPKLTPQERLQHHQAQSPKSHMLSSPPKTVGSHKKPRSETRKCRKVYGMDNRDMWCTQCKWKKACTRFLD